MKVGMIIFIGKNKVIRKKKKINKLIKDMKRHPFEGIGKPERLLDNLSGLWSRKIDSKDRIIYAVSDGSIIAYSCKDNYGDH
ncbi:hypothetical protein FC46_GL000454 [Lactobacillus kalixensis DSM 16043]|uniref:Endoribonuclease YoeB n=1 Tax=Lactobacillus kalixensis DSM 16043 TaxID=1423763 RepID=A0A0R1UGP5_9LACO|nr:hypothetical protein FC46_GL000454 [Lactobacillus kalixensis DSM 16043]